MSDQASTAKYGKKDWDTVRFGFATSLMVDTRLLSLAQNVELPDWPIKGESETPSKYIDYTWEEIQEIPGLADNPRRVDLLIDILKETMAFDEPFGEMVSTVEGSARQDDALNRAISRLGIPLDFPLHLGHLSQSTMEFCKNEDIKTVGQFAQFSQNMAQNIVMGGDFKTFLNALSNGDEENVAKHLPFRPRQKGLHLIEAIGLLTAKLSDNERCSLLKRYGKKLSEEEASQARLAREQINQLEAILVERGQEIIKYFPKQYDELMRSVAQGTSLERAFIVLNNEDREIIGARIITLCAKSSDAPAPVEEKKSGFFSRLFRKK